MAVVLFKDGKTARVEPKSLGPMIAAGWSTQDPEAPPPNYDGGKHHIGFIPTDATPLEQQQIVLGKMHIRVNHGHESANN